MTGVIPVGQLLFGCVKYMRSEACMAGHKYSPFSKVSAPVTLMLLAV